MDEDEKKMYVEKVAKIITKELSGRFMPTHSHCWQNKIPYNKKAFSDNHKANKAMTDNINQKNQQNREKMLSVSEKILDELGFGGIK